MQIFSFCILLLLLFPAWAVAHTSPLATALLEGESPPAGPFPGLGHFLIICLIPLVIWAALSLADRRAKKEKPPISTTCKIALFCCFLLISFTFFPEIVIAPAVTLAGYAGYYLSRRYRMIRKATKVSAVLLSLCTVFGFAAFDRFQLFPIGYEYSSAQQALIDQLGTPDAFEIVISGVDEADGMREEVWHYYEYETSYHFKNGEYAFSEDLTYPESSWVSTKWEPWQFNRYMGADYIWDDYTFQQEEDRWPDAMPSFKLEEVWPELIEGMDIRMQFHDRVTLGFDDITARLIYVSAPAVLEGRK